ncbi:cupin domain-containing protein [Rhizobium sp. WYJ-E13]|uniref:cupin domain-containing protein n=1 Tax=Rhizobium sp. WYJ-E13 TaxID=2849093 RepID=UPI001C1ED116|nr:cupin domain-containing protein [Rhizobium sp. WYJ-E13]QWW72587.1 cupin domain-containing protein [Rhizobium sp. WYJ-E13]
MKALILGVCMAMVGFGAMANDGSKPVVKEIGRFATTMSDQPIVLPTGSVEVAASLYTIPPGLELPVHRHKYPRYGYVLAGELTVTNEVTNKSKTFRKGEFVTEAVQQWHKGKSSGETTLELLVIDQAPAGTNNTELRSTDH